MKSVKRFFSTIGRKMGFNGTDSYEVQRKSYKNIKREDQGSEPIILSNMPHNPCKDKVEPVKESELNAKGDDNNEKQVPLKVQTAKIDDLSTRSLRRLRNMSERAVRKVKTFVSRPIKEATLRKFVGKVEAKLQAERSGLTQARGVKSGDDIFPKQKSKTSKENGKITNGPDHTVQNPIAEPDISLKSVVKSIEEEGAGELPSGSKLIYGNKDNDGKLIISGEPFWTVQKRPTDMDFDEGDSEDDIQLNAEIALEVYEGKTKLVDMPTVPIVLDPMNELSELQRRDGLFFTKDVLFGNSVRSMINLCDISIEPTVPSTQRNLLEMQFQEPLMYYRYQRACVAEGIRVPFFSKSKDSRISHRLSKRNMIVLENSSEPGTPEPPSPGTESEKPERPKRRSIRELIAESRKKAENFAEKSKETQKLKEFGELQTPPGSDLQIS